MKFFHAEIIECPSCKATYQDIAWVSGNTFGGKGWTDGYNAYPMMPEGIPLFSCEYCCGLFWTKELKPIGEVHWDESDGDDAIKWRKSKELAKPKLYEFIFAVDNKLYRDKEEEIYLRKKVIRKINDFIRHDDKKDEEKFSDYKEIFRANLIALIPLLDISIPNDKVLTGELYRELGEFEIAKKFFIDPPEEYKNTAPFIMQFIEERDDRVKELWSDY